MGGEGRGGERLLREHFKKTSAQRVARLHPGDLVDLEAQAP